MRRIVIAGSSSHCGKTTLTCGLLEAFRHRGLSVAAYKTGPDYIDPQFLRLAGKCEAYNLDTWLMSEERTRELFVRTSCGKDIAIIEGAMGLYDGGLHSTAGIAKLLGVPVILVVDAKSLGESAAVVALGFREYDHDVNLAGVILNRVGSSYHVRIIADELERLGIKCFGALRRDDGLGVPERHFGLLPVDEGAGYDSERLRLAVEDGIDIDELLKISETAPNFSTHEAANTTHYIHDNSTAQNITQHKYVRIGVARDEAFSFYYPESLGMLEELGAEIDYFSPIHDSELPKADGYIFGGGFPEMFAGELSGNASMLASVRECVRPVLAECGGYMYLCRSLRDFGGREYGMAGVIPAEAVMTDRAILGYMEAVALRKSILCEEGAILRGHEFHYSRIEPDFPETLHAFSLTRRNTNTSRFVNCTRRNANTSKIANCTKQNTNTSHITGYAHGNILASYLHINIWGYPELAERFITCLTLTKL